MFIKQNQPTFQLLHFLRKIRYRRPPFSYSREAEQSPNLDRRKQPVEGEFLNFKEKGKMTSFLKKRTCSNPLARLSPFLKPTRIRV